MKRSKRLRTSRTLRRSREEEDTAKVASSAMKAIDEKVSNKANTIFKTEEIQEICSSLNLEELVSKTVFISGCNYSVK